MGTKESIEDIMNICQCGCGKEIIHKSWHNKPLRGIPRYLRGHQFKDPNYKEPEQVHKKVECSYCGKEVLRRIVENAPTRFCSNKCMGLWKTGKGIYANTQERAKARVIRRNNNPKQKEEYQKYKKEYAIKNKDCMRSQKWIYRTTGVRLKKHEITNDIIETHKLLNKLRGVHYEHEYNR